MCSCERRMSALQRRPTVISSLGKKIIFQRATRVQEVGGNVIREASQSIEFFYYLTKMRA